MAWNRTNGNNNSFRGTNPRSRLWSRKQRELRRDQGVTRVWNSPSTATTASCLCEEKNEDVAGDCENIPLELDHLSNNLGKTIWYRLRCTGRLSDAGEAPTSCKLSAPTAGLSPRSPRMMDYDTQHAEVPTKLPRRYSLIEDTMAPQQMFGLVKSKIRGLKPYPSDDTRARVMCVMHAPSTKAQFSLILPPTVTSEKNLQKHRNWRYVCPRSAASVARGCMDHIPRLDLWPIYVVIAFVLEKSA
ncbi:hypothetical protein Cgig2_011502 [Carnegiea gigantea]|uniref:Uncharacterized protein n=1 Tax=Carnegiea gigantea TaxID=171969 RepID=A0A9Q1GT50_9CARY|nr:hypothetical protein Cgig2_011502 [Carnegiea gigantea]